MPVRLRFAFNQTYAVSGMSFNWTTIFVKVQNVGFDKQVDLVYSPLGSSAWFEAPLPFVAHWGNYDVFGSNSSSALLAHVESFAIRYRANGAERWDNNNGANYNVGSTFHGVVGGNVSLAKARAVRRKESGGGSPVDTGWLEGEIVVSNVAFKKRVGIVYSRDGGSTWNVVQGAYQGPVKAVASSVEGAEVWSFKTPQLNVLPGAVNYRLAAFLEVVDWGGQRFWDNNFGQDYLLSIAHGAELG